MKANVHYKISIYSGRNWLFFFFSDLAKEALSILEHYYKCQVLFSSAVMLVLITSHFIQTHTFFCKQYLFIYLFKPKQLKPGFIYILV